jgi:tRNA(Ile)-lysidine synthase
MPSSANAESVGLRKAVRGTIAADARVVLAVSGGRDSMVLLDAVVRWQPTAIVSVATFDHGTGSAARDAVELVREAARTLGLPFARGRGRGLAPTEAAWRTARWAFLRETAEALDARVATAHTRDDQLETVFIRALRGSGPRGLAGLYAASDVARPLLDVSRDVVAEYARQRALPVADDPSNSSLRYLRNRVRLELLPAFEAAHPGFGRSLLALARRAASWRDDVERRVDGMRPTWDGRSLFVRGDAFAPYDEHALSILWPALAARAGITLDRRGTERLARFGRHKRVSGRVDIAGGHVVVRHRHAFEIRPGSV